MVSALFQRGLGRALLAAVGLRERHLKPCKGYPRDVRELTKTAARDALAEAQTY